MEIAVVAGFAAFLGKYLEQQFNLTTSSANQLLGRRRFGEVGVSFPLNSDLILAGEPINSQPLLAPPASPAACRSPKQQFRPSDCSLGFFFFLFLS